MGTYDTTGAADLRVPPRRRRPELRHRGQVLPGRLRRVLPQPPVADRRTRARSTRRTAPSLRRRRQLGRRQQRHADQLHAAVHGDRHRCVDGQLTAACADGERRPTTRKACGNFAVNTVQPANAPFGTGAKIPLIDDDVYPNIGDRMTDAGVSWAWYSGGWDDAKAGHPGPAVPVPPPAVQLLRRLRPGQARPRATCRTRPKFFDAAEDGTLPTVSFVKPYGAENEHPGYASASERQRPPGRPDLRGDETGPQADKTLIVVTYDEFGGQWDHVSPPGDGQDHAAPMTRSVRAPGSRRCCSRRRSRTLRRRPHRLRHDVDHRDPRAVAGPRAGRDPRHGGQRPEQGRQHRTARPRSSPRALVSRGAGPRTASGRRSRRRPRARTGAPRPGRPARRRRGRRARPAGRRRSPPKSSLAANTAVGTMIALRWANSGRSACSSTSECRAVPAVAPSSTGFPATSPVSSTSKNILNSPL